MKKIVIAKFGGSSLANAKCIKNVKKLIKINKCNAIIVSAMGIDCEIKQKTTDALIALHQSNYDERLLNNIINRHKTVIDELQLSKTNYYKLNKLLNKTKKEILKNKDYDFTLSRGEFLCGNILATYLSLPFVDASDVIKFRGRVVNQKETKLRIKKQNTPFVIGGFYGTDQNGKIVTFPRGGSDCTASLVAISLGANELIKFTDQNGILKNFQTKNQSTIKKMSYAELLFLCKHNKNLMHPDSVPLLALYEITLKIKNTFKTKAAFTTCT